MEVIKRGGKRLGAGRKPVADKKILIALYVKGGHVFKFGGENKIKENLYDYIENFNPEKSIPNKSEEVMKPVGFIEKKEQVMSQFQAYVKELNECENYKQVVAVMEFVNNDNSIHSRDKATLKTMSEAMIEEKGFYND